MRMSVDDDDDDYENNDDDVIRYVLTYSMEQSPS
jgi:hypothetical protein